MKPCPDCKSPILIAWSRCDECLKEHDLLRRRKRAPQRTRTKRLIAMREYKREWMRKARIERMKHAPLRYCTYCNETLPEGRRRKFCSNECSIKYYNQSFSILSPKKIPGVKTYSDYLAEAEQKEPMYKIYRPYEGAWKEKKIEEE